MHSADLLPGKHFLSLQHFNNSYQTIRACLALLLPLRTMHSNLADPIYIPPASPSVCGRLVNQLPPTQAAALPGDAQPGLWYFDCARRPAAFLCQCESCICLLLGNALLLLFEL
jgi:hypothetical protein